MSCEENKAVVSRFVEEFWSQGNTAAADELMTADAAIFLPGRGQVSKESFKTFAVTLRSAFPNWYSTLEELIAEEDRVAERWTGRGTHQGEFLGVPPTGRQGRRTRFRVLPAHFRQDRGVPRAVRWVEYAPPAWRHTAI
jgi:predicted ester cyclase